MYFELPPDPVRTLRLIARAEGLDAADVELLCDVMRKADHWPDEFADRLGHGPGAGVVLKSHVQDAVDEQGLVEQFKARPIETRIVLRWLLGRPTLGGHLIRRTDAPAP